MRSKPNVSGCVTFQTKNEAWRMTCKQVDAFMNNECFTWPMGLVKVGDCSLELMLANRPLNFVDAIECLLVQLTVMNLVV